MRKIWAFFWYQNLWKFEKNLTQSDWAPLKLKQKRLILHLFSHICNIKIQTEMLNFTSVFTITYGIQSFKILCITFSCNMFKHLTVIALVIYIDLIHISSTPSFALLSSVDSKIIKWACRLNIAEKSHPRQEIQSNSPHNHSQFINISI